MVPESTRLAPLDASPGLVASGESTGRWKILVVDLRTQYILRIQVPYLYTHLIQMAPFRDRKVPLSLHLVLRRH